MATKEEISPLKASLKSHLHYLTGCMSSGKGLHLHDTILPIKWGQRDDASSTGLLKIKQDIFKAFRTVPNS